MSKFYNYEQRTRRAHREFHNECEMPRPGNEPASSGGQRNGQLTSRYQLQV